MLYIFLDTDGLEIGIGTLAEFDQLKADGYLPQDATAQRLTHATAH